MRDVKPDEVMEELDNLVRLDLLVQYNAGPKTFPKSSTLPASFRYQITPLGRKVAASPAIEDLVVESIGGSSHGPLRGFKFRWRLRNVVPNRRYSDPPFLCRLVDFSFGDPEVVVQPPVSGVVRLEPYRGDDHAVDGRSSSMMLYPLMETRIFAPSAVAIVPFKSGHQTRSSAALDDSPSAAFRGSSGPRRRPCRSRTRRTRSRRTGPATSPRHTAFAICKVPRTASNSPIGEYRGNAIWSLREDDYLGTFAASSRNRFSPTSVRACCVIFFSTSKGSVTISAPSLAASITCNGWRMDATRTSQSHS